MIVWIKRLLCRHNWEAQKNIREISWKAEKFGLISGTQLYKACTKCGKVKKWIFVEYEGGGYK